jgi:hypothetical protein
VSDWTGEALRRAALDALGSTGNQPARDALAHGSIELALGVARWEASAGRVEGHRVILGLDGDRLEQIRRDPAIYDAICAALASAVATHPAESLFELELGPAAENLTETPYRGRRP